jgi:hypothetical protein
LFSIFSKIIPHRHVSHDIYGKMHCAQLICGAQRIIDGIWFGVQKCSEHVVSLHHASSLTFRARDWLIIMDSSFIWKKKALKLKAKLIKISRRRGAEKSQSVRLTHN